ncbi:MAG: phosphatidylserine decarboxylase family protein [Gemmatimonadales bacterium]
MRVAPEGWPFIAIAWALAGALWFAAWKWWGGGWAWAVPGVWTAAALWVIAFFRDPVPHGPRGDALVLAPAAGTIVHITEITEPMYLQAPSIRISIFLSVFDVHVNRFPVGGTVELVHYNPGRFLHAASEKASLDNEQSSVGIRGPRGQVLVRQIAGAIARRIVTDPKAGDSVTQGARLGLIRFGSRTDLFLPQAAHPAIRVKVGDKVMVGETVLAEYTP